MSGETTVLAEATDDTKAGEASVSDEQNAGGEKTPQQTAGQPEKVEKTPATDGEKKPTEPKEPQGQPKPVKVEDYKLSLPGNAELAEEAVAEMAQIALEQGLTNDQAQAILDLTNGTLQSFRDQQKAEWDEQVSQWGEELKANREFGGDKLGQSVQLVKNAVLRFFPEGTMQQLNESGYGNNPLLFSGLLNIGRALQEGNMVDSNVSPGEAPRTAAQVLFGDTPKKE